MNLYFRFFLLLLIRSFVKKPSSPFEKCLSKFRVNPIDLDLNFHMNNGRYLSIMDLGRFDLMLKSKIFWKLFRKGYYPIVTSESIRFKKSFNIFQTFYLVTQMDAWDEKDFYMSQKFVKDGLVYAEGYIKARFRKRGRKESITTAELFSLLGLEYTGNNMSGLADLQRGIEGCLVMDKNFEISK